jgi:hypothetical protein
LEDPTAKFLRVRRDKKGEPLALETSIVTYSATAGRWRGVRVDLIGALHVADKAYYDRLNGLFRSYDALLYELVAPEGVSAPAPREGGRGPVGSLQVGMKSMLGLEFQLDCIDYARPNFTHADMTREEFAKSMKDRGESFTQLFFRMMGQAIAQQSADPVRGTDWRLLAAFFSKDRELRLKRILAEEFECTGGQLAALEGPDGSTLITERNKKALKVLSRQLESGKKRLGIFYGAGHLPDMEKRLLKEFGLRAIRSRWLTAWSLSEKGTRGAAKPPG